MLAALKRLALVMVMATLPVQGLAAVVIPICQYDNTPGLSIAEYDHDASVPDRDHPIAASDLGSDHCGASGSFAIPVMGEVLAPAADAERSIFVAAYCSGFIPEQPQRPPLA